MFDCLIQAKQNSIGSPSEDILYHFLVNYTIYHRILRRIVSHEFKRLWKEIGDSPREVVACIIIRNTTNLR